MSRAIRATSCTWRPRRERSSLARNEKTCVLHQRSGCRRAGEGSSRRRAHRPGAKSWPRPTPALRAGARLPPRGAIWVLPSVCAVLFHALDELRREGIGDGGPCVRAPPRYPRPVRTVERCVTPLSAHMLRPYHRTSPRQTRGGVLKTRRKASGPRAQAITLPKTSSYSAVISFKRWVMPEQAEVAEARISPLTTLKQRSDPEDEKSGTEEGHEWQAWAPHDGRSHGEREEDPPRTRRPRPQDARASCRRAP